MEQRVEGAIKTGQSGQSVAPRTQFYCYLALSFVLPICIVVAYAAYSQEEKSLPLVAFLALSLGGGSGWLILRSWERKMQRSVASLVQIRIRKIQEVANFEGRIAEYQNEINRLKQQIQEVKSGYEHQIGLLNVAAAKSKEEIQTLHISMDEKLEQMRVAYLEFEDLRKELQRIEEEFERAEKEAALKLEHKESLIAEYQRTIAEQRLILEKKQSYIGKLETKVRDLMYEIRSLLQLEGAPASTVPPVDLSNQAMVDYYLPKPKAQAAQPAAPAVNPLSYLKNYVTQAEALVGSESLGGRFGVESRLIDQRPFFDQLKEESFGLIFVYSPSDRKFIFVSNHVKTLLGWGNETFMKDFPRLVTAGYSEWKESLSATLLQKESFSQLGIQSKAGRQIPLTCAMGLITKGPLAHHVLGVLTPIS